MNYLVGYSTEQFLKIQIESSKREAKEMASFISSQIKNGSDKEIIVNDIQSSIENTNTEIGYICMYDWSGRQVCHPDPKNIGKVAGPDESYVSSVDDEINSKDFYTYLKTQKEGGGVRSFNYDRKSEIIYLYPVKGSQWIIAAHANMSRINSEHESLKANFIIVYTATGSLIVVLSLFMVRLLGGNYERQLKLKIERLSHEVLNQSKSNKAFFAYKAKMELNNGIKDKETATVPTSKKRILTYSRNELVPLEVEEIAHIYTENTVTYVKSIDGKTSNCNSSLDELYNKLDSSLFFRANRQFILSINAIDKILRYGNNQLKIEVIPSSAADIIISKNKAAEFKSWLNR